MIKEELDISNGLHNQECCNTHKLFTMAINGDLPFIDACAYIEVTQSHLQQGVNTVVPINISRCQHLTGNFSGLDENLAHI